MSSKRKMPVKAPVKVAAPVMKQSAKQPSKTRIDETRTSVSVADPLQTAAPDMIEISSDSESDYDDISDVEEEALDQKTPAKQTQAKHLSQRTQQPTPDDTARSIPKSRDVDMLDPSQADGSDEEPSAPTFGDLIRNHETIDVPSSLTAQPQTPAAGGALTIATPKTLAPPSLASLGTVLSQALKTDDTDLLESCLHTTDLNTVRNTIQRLDSSLAGILLTKLAARMHRRPGRAHTLMSWVQWVLVAHGGALASQPDIQKRLSELNRVLEERSRGLTSLLALKGKLDMLEAQMTLRRTNRIRRSTGRGGFDSDEDDMDEDDEEGIIYVEGEEANQANGILTGRRDFDDDDFPAINGTGADSDDDSEDEDEDDMDVDAELAEESLDEDEVDHDDVEESGEEDESEPESAAPPAKVQKKAATAFSKRR